VRQIKSKNLTVIKESVDVIGRRLPVKRTHKKLTILRLVIFYLLAFVPQLIIVPVLSNLLGEPMFTGEAAASSLTLTSGIIGMCLPALANVITRIITREGFRNNYLSLEMRGGKWKYYIISLVAPLIYMIVTAMIVLLIFCGDAESWFASEKIAVRVWALSDRSVLLFLCLCRFSERNSAGERI